MDSVTSHLRSTAGFCEHGPSNWQLHPKGALAGVRLAVKDLFAVAGYTNTAGNPDWLRTHGPATKTADAVQRLMDAGSVFCGFTQTDELAYALEGNNEHFGKSENPKLPGHACGGSSMGSAAAVGSRWADVGLGTDTGGSIRVPASYCGLYGLRPSHGVVSTDGLIGLAPRFDTVGWFAGDAALLRQVGEVLLPADRPVGKPDTLSVDPYLMSQALGHCGEALNTVIDRLSGVFGQTRTVDLGLQQRFANLNDVFRVLQGRAIAHYHGDWLNATQPTFSKPITERLRMALALTDAEVEQAESQRQAFHAHVQEQLGDDGVLLLPTTPSTAPKLGEDTSELRPKLLTLTAISGLTGSAQVHLPLMPLARKHHPSRPYGFSLLMPSGQDHTLLRLSEAVTDAWNLGV
ncbi:amidase family protein [Reinekea blandensis]|uniref:Amidase n=1 Tax=Reinekea blandensis MED297 TaxID=314283 RepID=A4BCY9_9GAMM|nr:amidase family protein [Reinekea blandensis]EAR10071.1 amidase [Reinekea sp. MED297] [Reinekea blandensis MED297]